MGNESVQMAEVLKQKLEEVDAIVEAKPIDNVVKKGTVTGVEKDKEQEQQKNACDCSFLSVLPLQWLFPSREPAVTASSDGEFTAYYDTPVEDEEESEESEKKATEEEEDKEEKHPEHAEVILKPLEEAILVVEVSKTPEKPAAAAQEIDRPVSVQRKLSMTKQESVLYIMSPQKIPPTDIMFEVKPELNVSAAYAAKVVKDSLEDPFVLIGWQIELIKDKLSAGVRVVTGVQKMRLQPTKFCLVEDVTIAPRSSFKLSPKKSIDTMGKKETWDALKRSKTKSGKQFRLLRKVIE